MRFLFLFICSHFSVVSFSQLSIKTEWTTKTSMSSSEVIYYKADNKLAWNDFKGNYPNDNSRTAAVTMSGFGYTASMAARGNKGELDIKVYCFFSKNKSWVKPGKTTSYILNHEQHHFDISYLAACIFIDKLQSTVMTKYDYSALINKIYDESIALMNRMQDDYDGQTRNGLERDVQERWNKFIDGKIALAIK